MTLQRLLASIQALIRKRHLDRELDDDILAHLELAEKDATARGLSPEEARWAARRSFGGIEQMKEQHRQRRSLQWIDSLQRDLRYGLAALLRAPAFSAVVIGVLAIGIGGTVAMFSIVDAVLLKPLPFPEPEHIVRVWEAPRPGVINATKAPEFVNWKRSATVFEALSAEQPLLATLTGKGEPQRLSGKAVTADYFKVFATNVKLGRTFAPDEDRPGTAPVIVLSHAAWQNYFSGDPGILHRRAILDGASHEIIGVLASGAFDRDRTQFWKPLVFTPAQLLSETHWLSVYGRLRTDATLLQARERMHAMHAALLETVPVNEREGTVEVESLSRLLVGTNLQRSISVAFGAVALVLLISCANVANLLLAQGATRRTELSVRAALGAGRGRLIAQLLTESFVLCLAGGAAGVGVAYLLIRLTRPVLSQSLPFTADVTLDLRVLGFAAALALGVALLAGVLPALQTSFGNLADGLKQSTRVQSGTHSRVRRVIVVGEVALSLVLVCGAGLLVKSLLKLQSLDTGVRIDNVVTTSLDLPVNGYPTAQKAALFYEAVAERIRSAPGVAQAGIATQCHFSGSRMGKRCRLPESISLSACDSNVLMPVISAHSEFRSSPVVVSPKGIATERPASL